MKRGLAIVLLTLALGGRAAQAQAPVAPFDAVPPDAGGDIDDAGDRIYGGGEYLLWWMRGQGLPPLVTASPPGTPINQAGVLGPPGTVIFFGNSTVNDDARSGMRFTLGGWVDGDHTLGVEGQFLMLEAKPTRFAASSGGSPILGRPFLDATTGRPNAELAAFPGDLAGSIDAAATSEGLIGAGLLFRKNLCCDCGFRLDGLAGYRCLRVCDGLTVNEDLVSINPASPAFIVPGTRIQVGDAFGAKNEFNGFDLGLDARFDRGPWGMDLRARAALGDNRQTVDIGGITTVTVPGTPPFTSPGGLLALQTNSGHHSRDQFSVVPEVDLKAGYQITPRLRATVGYTFLYWSDVVRAADQVDLSVNPNLLANAPAPAPGPQRPAFDFQRSDFWAQGLDFGLEFRY